MTQLKDKLSVIEKLLATLTGTCALSYCLPSSSEDPPSSPPPASVH